MKDFAIADESGHVTQGLGHMAAVTAAFVSGDRLVTGDAVGKGVAWSIRDGCDISSQKAVGWMNLLPPMMDFVFLTLRTRYQ